MTVPARLSVATLGVRDVAALRGFYERLGWTTNTDPGGDFAAFPLGGAVLCLFDLEALAAARDAGATVLAEPVDRDWGGRSAYFADPEGNTWEVAWLPGAEFDRRGALIWPF